MLNVPKMRAKVRVLQLNEHYHGLDKVKSSETVSFVAVCRKEGYADTDGDDENNTYAKYTPSARFDITIANPALFDQFKNDQEYYVDFTQVESAIAETLNEEEELHA